MKRKAEPGFEVGPRSWYKLADTCAGPTLSFTQLAAANGRENIVIRRLRDYIPRVVAISMAEENRREEVHEEGRKREMTAMAFWPAESPFSILFFVLYIHLEYGFPALLVGLVIWRVLKTREYRRAEEIEKHVIVTRQIKEMLRRDTTGRRRTR